MSRCGIIKNHIHLIAKGNFNTKIAHPNGHCKVTPIPQQVNVHGPPQQGEVRIFHSVKKNLVQHFAVFIKLLRFLRTKVKHIHGWEKPVSRFQHIQLLVIALLSMTKSCKPKMR